MKNLLIVILLIGMVSGCATTQVATNIGVDVGAGFQAAAAKGEVSADQSIKAWPFISGEVKGVLADNYPVETPIIAQNIITKLDVLAAKDTLTNEEKGFVIGSFVRLEAVAIQQGWTRYGVNIYQLILNSIK